MIVQLLQLKIFCLGLATQQSQSNEWLSRTGTKGTK